MSKGAKINIIIVCLLLAFFIAIDSTAPAKINWSERYDPTGTLPFDTKVLMSSITESKQYSDVILWSKSFYELVSERPELMDTDEYMVLDIGYESEYDKQSKNHLIQFAHKGNDLFLIYNKLDRNMEDTLDKYLLKHHNLKNASYQFKFYNDARSYTMPIVKSTSFIVNEDTNYYSAIGYYVIEQDTFSHFISGQIGKGKYFLHASPILFTNYALLHDTAAITYANKCLSYSQKKKLIIISPAFQNYDAIEGNPLKFILKNPPLRYAWYLILIGSLLFIIFKGKRRQRVIPILTPEENTTVAYTQTIGNLMYEEKNYTAIAHKRIQYFFAYIRSKYNLDTSVINDYFIQQLAVRANKSVEQVKEDILELEKYSLQPHITKNQLIRLDKIIYNFKSNN